MYLLIISLISSLLVGFVLKTSKISNIKDLIVIITVNYITAILATYIIFNNLIELNINNFGFYDICIFTCLGILMPTIFLILKKSLDLSGIVKTDLFQRISLIIPVSLSFFLFNEILTISKLIAIILSFISVFLLLYKKSTNNGNHNTLYLLFVFLGYGVVDTLFKIVATNNQLPYITSLFLIFILCGLTSIVYLLVFKSALKIKLISKGLILGTLNFTNIYFYMKAHKYYYETPTLVFITMNLGVILGGLLIGKFYFNENINKVAYFGILSAIISVILLALIQLNYI